MEALALTAIIGGTTLSTISTLEAGKEAAKAGREAYKYGVVQKEMYEEDARIAQKQAEEKAKAITYKGQYESREKRREKRRAIASRIAQISAQGGSITGGKLVILADEAAEYEADASMIMHNAQLDAAQTRYAGLLRATQLRNRGQMALYQGDVAKYQGAVARRTSRMRAFSNVAMTAGTMALFGGFGNGGGMKTLSTAKTRVSPSVLSSQRGAEWLRGGYIRNFP